LRRKKADVPVVGAILPGRMAKGRT